MNIEQTRNGNALTIAPEGYLDTTTAPELRAVLESALEGVKELTFDFEKLEYISSSGLRQLLFAHEGDPCQRYHSGDIRGHRLCGYPDHRISVLLSPCHPWGIDQRIKHSERRYIYP